MGRGRLSLQADDIVQVHQIQVGSGLRRADLGRTIIVPASEPGDIELVVSDLFNTDLSWGYGAPVSVGDKLFWVGGRGGADFGRVFNVHRYGDAFASTQEDLHELRDASIASNMPEALFTSGQAVSPTHFRNCESLAVLDNDAVLIHSTVRPVSSTGREWDEFYILHFDTDALTAVWDGTIDKRPLLAESINHGGAATVTAYKMCGLDGSHAAHAGNRVKGLGWQPNVFMLEYDGTDLTAYGPFMFGAKSAEGGANPKGQTMLFRVDDDRILAVWYDQNETNISGITTTVWDRMVLHAQVLEYDTVLHTFTPGPLRHFESGVETEPWAAWYPEGNVLVLASIAWDEPEGLWARSLLVNGTDVAEGHTQIRAANIDTALPDYQSYFYSFAIVGAADRLAVIWSDVGDDGGGAEGQLKYAKIRVGMSGGERGALGVYETGVIADVTGEMYQDESHFGFVTLPDGTGLTWFDQYIDDYAYATQRAVLAREVP